MLNKGGNRFNLYINISLYSRLGPHPEKCGLNRSYVCLSWEFPRKEILWPPTSPQKCAKNKEHSYIHWKLKSCLDVCINWFLAPPNTGRVKPVCASGQLLTIHILAYWDHIIVQLVSEIWSGLLTIVKTDTDSEMLSQTHRYTDITIFNKRKSRTVNVTQNLLQLPALPCLQRPGVK